MQVTISHAGLLKVVKACIKAADRKATMPILSHVLLEAEGETLKASATDLEVAIQCQTPASIQTPGSVALPVKKLFDYLRLLPEEDISISVGQSLYATLSCGRSKTRMAGLPKDQFPEIPSMPEPLAKIPAGVLISAIEKVFPAIAEEESRFTLNGALTMLANGSVGLVSTDGHRLALVSHHGDFSVRNQTKMLVPRKALDDLIRLAHDRGVDGEVEIAEDGNHLFFAFGDCTLACGKLAGSFPDYERVLPKQHKIRVEVSVEDLRPALERAKQFADASHAIQLILADGTLRVTASTDEAGETEESISIEHSGPDLDIGFNANYLLDALRVLPSGKAALLLNDKSTAGEIVPAGEGAGCEFRYVVMPMRI